MIKYDLKFMDLHISEAENGFVVYNSSNDFSDRGTYPRQRWVAHTPKDLGELIKQLSASYLDNRPKATK